MNVSVYGAGAWGTALAGRLARRHDTLLWARDPQQAAEVAARGCNERYLPGVALPAALRLSADVDAATAHACGGLIIVATPVAGLRELMERLGPADPGTPIVWLCKGFEHGSGALPGDVAAAALPGRPVGVVSGPSFALEVARGQPTALVAASQQAVVCERVVRALHGESLRVYSSSDVIGVEVAGAMKNVMAVATGIADGMPRPGAHRTVDPAAAADVGLGLNARAALITRGLAEMTRLGVALGAQPETFMGLSGLGDLVLTATGDLSRNRRVGLLLAQGLALPQILAQLGHVAEGVLSAATALRRGRDAGVDLPITQAVVDVLQGRVAPADAMQRLMGRGARAEF